MEQPVSLDPPQSIVVVERGEHQSGHGHFYNVANEIGQVGPGGICLSIKPLVIDISNHLHFDERQARLLPYMFKVIGTTTGDWDLMRERVLVIVKYGRQMLKIANEANEASKRGGWFGLGYAQEYLRKLSEDLDPQVFKHNQAHIVSQASHWSAMLLHESLYVMVRSSLPYSFKQVQRKAIFDLAFAALDEICGDVKPMTIEMARKVEAILAGGMRRYDLY